MMTGMDQAAEHGLPETVPALEAGGVWKGYGSVRALEGVSLRVTPGECVALVGESGSGKTTLLRMFNRMVEPDRGIVRVLGRDALELDPVSLRRRTGYVQQEGGLLPHWDVLRNVCLVPTLLGQLGVRELAKAALDRVGLPPSEFGRRWPRELSGGQRQRVALARALAAEPDVILLDEPFGALDAITRGEMQEMFRELQRTLGFTSVLVTHDLREALRLADRVAVMKSGEVVRLASPEELLADPGVEYVAQLLARAGVDP
ncbi:MAG: ATP-binding cassette domain-containing protein [Gemmatimonadota bacterium]